jgi:Centromere-binding protein ParB C-terminal
MTPGSDAAAGAGALPPEGSAAQSPLMAAAGGNAALSGAAPAPASSAPSSPVPPASLPAATVQAAAQPAAVQPGLVQLPPLQPAPMQPASVQPGSVPPPVALQAAPVQPVPVGPADAGSPARVRRRSRTSPDRVQRSFYLSRDLVDRARAAVFATMREPGEAYNVSQLVGRGLEAEVRRLEQTYNAGTPFPHVHHVPSGPSPEGVERIRAGVTAPRRRRS